ncbi:MAG: LPS export ABC transporter permease LptG [Deltaproteobacteria bacterium]|nr:LPS export ABC transporter permease LptG [Deltaproteobacteria bacterium]
MSILYKYLTREIFKYFCIVLTLVIGLFIAVDYLGNMDEFIESGISYLRALRFVLLKIPFMIVLFIPIGILMAVLVVFGLMSKNNEMVALKATGVSIYYLLRPVVAIGVLFSVLLFILSEIVVPITMSEANRIQKIEIRKETAVTSSGKNIWIKGNRRITHIAYFNPGEKSVFGITLNIFGQDFRLTRRVDAKKGAYRQGEWILMDLIEQKLDRESGNYQVTFHKEKSEQLHFLPEDLKRVIKKSQEMSFSELYSYVRKVEAEGYDATIYRVDLHAKTAFPFICIIMSLVGAGIAAMGKMNRGLPVSIALGTGTAFLYWVFYSFSLSLGYGEMLPPIIAAWTANLVFLCFGLITLQYVE